ncbi:MAG: hypothetical protein HY644_14540 [Acidobacteria bacterium]|nr:hypothetical protein [Acidobacteriota bacterium]
MRTLITFALDSEFRPWRRLRSFRRIPAERGCVWETRVGKVQVRVIITGVGPQGVAQTLSGTLWNPPPHVCLSSGLAGGLKPGYSVGEILAARAVGSFHCRQIIHSEAGLFDLAIRCGAKGVDLFRSSQTIVVTAQEKSELSALADAVEMESFTVMQAMATRGVPSVAVRAIVDPLEVDLPVDFSRVLGERGQVSPPRFFAQLVRYPHRVPALMRFGFDSRRAAASLVQFLDCWVGSLSEENRYAQPSSVMVGAG